MESAETENRPGFQLYAPRLEGPGSPLDGAVGHRYLATFTPTLRRPGFQARNQKRGVEILYAKVPETGPITAVILEAVFEAMDEAMLRTLTEERVAAVLEALAHDLDETPKERWKNLLHTLIGRITLDPETLQCQVYYRLTSAHANDDTSNMASPRGFEPLLLP